MLLFISLVSAQVEDGQLLPGLDRPVPDPAFDACFNETALLLDNQAIRNEIIRVDDQYLGRSFSDFCTVYLDGAYICDVDWSKFDSNLSQICNANGGAYQESAHEVTCRASDNDTTYIFKHSNLPDCFGNDCEKADIERLLVQAIIKMEQGYETTLKIPCSSEYDIEDPTLDQMEQEMEKNLEQDNELQDQIYEGGICLRRTNATPDTCGALQSVAEGQQCDCYDFCDGVMVGCGGLGEIMDVTCNGALVAGCTPALLGGVPDSGATGTTLCWSLVSLLPALLLLLLAA
jgi:hypothetical protein